MSEILYRKNILKFPLLNIFIIILISFILITIFLRYNEFYQKYPILTLSVTNSLLGGISNMSAQTISAIHSRLRRINSFNLKTKKVEMENISLDNPDKSYTTFYIPSAFRFSQLIRFMSYNFLTTPIQLWWYSFLDHLSTISRISNTAELIKRILMDQFLFTPISLTFYLVFMSLTEELSKKKLKNKFNQGFFSILKANYCIWPAVQLINFKYIPLKYQIPFLNSISIFWTIYLTICDLKTSY
ncbi:hypothetical protein PNEG_02137 [Pneumocystis murina B123]|uniref:Protein sym1 n=1 Tax=Pneumocystis murina (strain B123) TaxID=1069680 RepID=M7NR13_PNEMU|nr:hypothetical protein PNEG_02137 [Pneumocystis murina B123]EMR09551.2 hypothetical protein PNEG_02137 [Pneumocystis murina B123]